MSERSFRFSEAQKKLLALALETGPGGMGRMKLLTAEPGHVRLAFELPPQMITPWGTAHGSFLNSIVEIPSTLALLTEMADDLFAVTNDIFIQHVRPLPASARYETTGKLLRQGKTMAWTEVVIFADEKPVTYARVTKTLLPRPVEL